MRLSDKRVDAKVKEAYECDDRLLNTPERTYDISVFI
jgi:hypothetical protein